MVGSIRNLGRPGIASMAIAAVDVALWDLKARILGLPLVLAAWARARPGRRSTARAGSPLIRSRGCPSSSRDGWSAGIPRVKMKVGSSPDEDPGRVRAAREAIGPDAQLFVDANGAYSRKQALELAERFRADAAVSWFEEPVSSDDLEGLRAAPRPCACRDADRRRGVRLRPAVLRAHARRRRRGRAPGRRDPLRRDHRAAASRRAVPRARDAAVAALRALDPPASRACARAVLASGVLPRPHADRGPAVRRGRSAA